MDFKLKSFKRSYRDQSYKRLVKGLKFRVFFFIPLIMFRLKIFFFNKRKAMPSNSLPQRYPFNLMQQLTTDQWLNILQYLCLVSLNNPIAKLINPICNFVNKQMLNGLFSSLKSFFLTIFHKLPKTDKISIPSKGYSSEPIF